MNLYMTLSLTKNRDNVTKLIRFDQKFRTANPHRIRRFADSQDVFNNFALSQDAREGLEIVYANYECGDYDGSATVFFYSSNTGKYHEAYGSHCSCYGLEDQWAWKK